MIELSLLLFSDNNLIQLMKSVQFSSSKVVSWIEYGTFVIHGGSVSTTLSETTVLTTL